MIRNNLYLICTKRIQNAAFCYNPADPFSDNNTGEIRLSFRNPKFDPPNRPKFTDIAVF